MLRDLEWYSTLSSPSELPEILKWFCGLSKLMIPVEHLIMALGCPYDKDEELGNNIFDSRIYLERYTICVYLFVQCSLEALSPKGSEWELDIGFEILEKSVDSSCRDPRIQVIKLYREKWGSWRFFLLACGWLCGWKMWYCNVNTKEYGNKGSGHWRLERRLL